MHSIAKAFLSSVRPSVKHEDCDKTKESSAQIFIPQERTFILVFRHEEWLVGSTLCTEILSNTDPPHSSKNANFQAIFACSASAVTPSEKSSVNANGKFTTCFPIIIFIRIIVQQDSKYTVGLNRQ